MCFRRGEEADSVLLTSPSSSDLLEGKGGKSSYIEGIGKWPEIS